MITEWRKMMELEAVKNLYKNVPRFHVGFYPTPFHKLDFISEKYGVDVYLKREDLSGPSNFGGNKIRKVEFIIGEALEAGVRCFVTQGGYQSNSAMELAAAAKKAGIQTILCLSDTIGQGIPEELRGNLVLDKLLGVETIFVEKPEHLMFDSPEYMKMAREVCEKKTAEMNEKGIKTWYIPSGCAIGNSFVAHVWTYLEILEQAKALGVELDYVYHTTGTGGTAPGLLAGRLLTGAKAKIRSVSINHYGPGLICSEEEICRRVKNAYATLKLVPPADEEILAEIDVDEDFVGKGYAIPSEEGTAAIREVAEAVFLDPVYTGKGFAGLLHHIRTGKVPKGSKVAFIHTGGTGALFAEQEMLGSLLV